MDFVNLNLVEDDSVLKKIYSTSKTLEKKYKKKRKINSTILKEKTKMQKIISAIVTVFMVLFVLLSLIVCFSISVSRINNTTSGFAGFNIFQIASSSMESSGLRKGETIIVRTVDPKSISVGDAIGFYVYQPSYSTFSSHQVKMVTKFDYKLKTEVPFKSFFGFTNEEQREAGKAGATIVFHGVVAVYEDENGERWFKTKGTSNNSADIWRINEKYVIGAYIDSPVYNFASSTLTFFNNSANFLLLLLFPFLFLSIVLIFNIIKQIQVAKLELDVVEEKRKITDEICVKNDVGYKMDIKTKYKVLAQARDEEKKTYMNLLWKSDELPQNVRKYVLKKQISLNYMKAMLNLNRECEQMLKDNIYINTVAKHYIAKKQSIENENKKNKN